MEVFTETDFFYFYYNTLQRTIFINCFDLKMRVSVKIARSKIIMF